MIPVVEFSLSNAGNASTGYTPFYINGLTHLRVPLALPLCGAGLGGGEVVDRLADISAATVQQTGRLVSRNAIECLKTCAGRNG